VQDACCDALGGLESWAGSGGQADARGQTAWPETRENRPNDGAVSKVNVNFRDMVKCEFTAKHSNQLWVAFVIDVSSRKIVGWNVPSRLTTESLPLQALNTASWLNQGYLEGLVHYVDHGS